MRTEIERLRTQQQLSGRVLAALTTDESEQVLDQLRSGETIEAITGNLDKRKSPPSRGAFQQSQSKSASPYSSLTFSDAPQSNTRTGSWTEWGGEGSTSFQAAEATHPDAMQWSPEASRSSSHAPGFLVESPWQQHSSGALPRGDSTSEIMKSGGRGTFLGAGSFQNLQGPNYSDPWTTVTSDVELIQHLMALYFCWEYPTFATLDQGTFLADFKNGNPRYCSSLLVNSMLAVGCRCSTNYAARADPNDSTTAGDHFFAEAVRIFESQTDHHQLTTIQALGLMSIREASRGNTSNSHYYSGQSIRLAIEMGLHLGMESDGSEESNAERTVRCATFWGAFSLDQ